MSSQQPKPDLDLIQLVQRARMQHDRQARPSEVGGIYWIESKPLEEGLSPTPRAGEWVIETTASAVDALWAKVKAATEAGELGYKSKVSTSPAKNQAAPDSRVIVVRTRDADDAADVARVEARLRALGIVPARYERI